MSCTLYHGTDTRIVRMTDNERQTMLSACLKVVKSLGSFFTPYRFEPEKLSEMFVVGSQSKTFLDEFQHTLRHINSFLIGNQLYQYDSFYLTNSLQRAKDFARRSCYFGEIGFFAHSLRAAYSMLKEKDPLNDDLERAMYIVEKFAEGTPQPIVFVFNNIEREFLKGEKGNDIDWNDPGFMKIIEIDCNFRYLKKVCLNLDEAIPVSDNC